VTPVIRLVVADDHPIVRGGLRRMVELEPDLEIAGEADTAESLFAVLAAAAAADAVPDVLLLDVGMPGPGVLEVLRRVGQAYPGLRTLVLSVYPEEQYGLRTLRAGAAGYLTKDQSPELLVRAVRQVAAGHRFLSPALADRLVDGLARGYAAARHELLSAREFAVLVALGEGRSVPEIAGALGLSPKTVTTYRVRLLEKLGLCTNGDLVRYVREQGLSA
jgi:DNA-binding NarL/FixJ family response regulator